MRSARRRGYDERNKREGFLEVQRNNAERLYFSTLFRWRGNSATAT